MKIKVLTFGIARDIIGTSQIELELHDEATTALDLKKKFLEKYPAFAALNYLQIAVNQEFAADQQQISPGDEVALIPPVSGG